MEAELKDTKLNWLAEKNLNIAQFVSYGPDGEQRFSRVLGSNPNTHWGSVRDAVFAIYKTQTSPSVNIRSFLPQKFEGNPFVMGITDASCAEAKVRELNQRGFYVIINENISVRDCAFSGVLFGDLMEVAPFDTPRCVEKPGTMALPRALGLRLIEKVYRFAPHIPFSERERVEFSIYPMRVGYLRDHSLIWQVDFYSTGQPRAPEIRWPHNYSRAMGDKAFGLLIAHLMGFPVPYTIVIGRHIPKFELGEHTGNAEVWMRTCPNEQVPGKFPTFRGWKDPFRLMQECDPEGTNISSLLVQDSAGALYSGAALVDANNQPLIEGKGGYGDGFMVGAEMREQIPQGVLAKVGELHRAVSAALGAVRLEWVFDGARVWIVQLHIGKTESAGSTIYPGEPEIWLDVDAKNGLEHLRTVAARLPKNYGIRLRGNVGITSHFGDILRKAKIPSRLIA